MAAPTPRARVLVVDDDPTSVELLALALSRRGYQVTGVSSGAAALAAMTSHPFDAVVTDARMAGMSGIDLCERITTTWPSVPVLLMTGFACVEFAVAALRAGARDFFVKPVMVDSVETSLSRILAARRLAREVEELPMRLRTASRFDELVSVSDVMRNLCDLLERIAGSDSSVLITGETGSGKELVARALHRSSPRKAGPFVALNCAAMPESLLESELFGHARGAFTDARAAHRGLFVQATGGSIFLDEIGEMPLGLQPKLLRALQERTVRPVGGSAEVPFDVRLIAATNRDLEAAVAAGRFRHDLFYRLDVIHVAVPPLRDRIDDILLLAQHFVTQAAAASGRRGVHGLSVAAADRLLAYPWPGNVRELQNTIERAVALTRRELIDVDDLPERVRGQRPTQRLFMPPDAERVRTLSELESEYAHFVVDLFDGNKTLAAQRLGIDRKTLARKLRR